MKLKIFFDGSSHGNPGPSGIGIIVYDESFREVTRFSEHVGVRTNNEAEYLALKKSLEIALELRADEVELYSDSELLIKQMNKEYHVRNEKLSKLHREIQDLMKNIKVKMIHISREENRGADKLANKAVENLR
ncbi:MAG: ribonuclease HI family protein [Thaumarchaeota archaeon]|jgi:ribonuclease HI|nr:ribonuclease HI family protein [Candidatus Geocrenenecus arthurdayi]MCL7403086.1 ribonuclease HI family protein [Candidatus Geocrenenecus arthurdayi]